MPRISSAKSTLVLGGGCLVDKQELIWLSGQDSVHDKGGNSGALDDCNLIVHIVPVVSVEV